MGAAAQQKLLQGRITTMAVMAPLGTTSPGRPSFASFRSIPPGLNTPRQPGYSVGMKLPKEGQSWDGSWTPMCMSGDELLASAPCILQPRSFISSHSKEKPKYLHFLGSKRLQSESLGRLLEYLKVVDDLPGKQSILPSPVEITGARRDRLHIKTLLTVESLPMGQLRSVAKQLSSAGQE